jgi:hypothetical protein
MAQQIKAAFIALIPGSDPAKHRSTIATEMLELSTVLVKDREQAVEVAKQLAEQGCGLIELCGGFGFVATAKVADAVRGKAAVGAVRFDIHPAFGKSGDEMF